jgi:hypothetical protein
VAFFIEQYFFVQMGVILKNLLSSLSAVVPHTEFWADLFLQPPEPSSIEPNTIVQI